MRKLMAAMAVVLLLGGCGSSDGGGDGVASAGGNSAQPPSASATQQGSTADQMQQFAKCMRDNGVDMPDPGADGSFGGGADDQADRDSPAFQKATEACKQFLPGGGDLSKLDPKLIDQIRQLTQCLRDNGVDVPDPDPNSPMLGMGQLQNIDRDSPVFKKAMEACKDKVPGRLGG
jgi:outer membrane lipopolysaccharide assembly protein LptE/RlpB